MNGDYLPGYADVVKGVLRKERGDDNQAKAYIQALLGLAGVHEYFLPTNYRGLLEFLV